MNNIIRIGTRDSKLALWQANYAKSKFEELNVKTKIITIKSEGDLNQITPLYEFGVTGIFTKNLDRALLNNDIDVAVHSFKDVPIKPAEGLKISCIFKRANPLDVLVIKSKNIDFSKNLTIATSSIRRKCQWLKKYPNHKIEVLRGNVDTRLEKLKNSDWDGAIFAQAGLERLELNIKNKLLLKWMIPSAAQGAIALAIRREEVKLIDILKKMNCSQTMHCVNQERIFLKLMGGGCSMPISAHASYEENDLILQTNICSLDNKHSITDISIYKKHDLNAGLKSYNKILKKGADKILKLNTNR